ncbi:hypothetical protein R9C00_11575 [Flammeovirgaceae bacterium SG7u.111]|nr:hypothetical protein [Flammeovirgaceae bacterium SG7u.132]WPO33204.1 hypothetical protein R9C00_15995 [Flammeovirgaceae bacterium SG7u.111]MDW7692745.1 hypothetical protein [Flammeovirgaceae bacterium SG7u.132]MDW7694033.1 hypothetical protein [Flammeovirgaceae bacterium SG7u.132]WPO36744.1 hypothetical protein R9C00_04705 [Flammeovirgaceae bacterium SG7u.111]
MTNSYTGLGTGGDTGIQQWDESYSWSELSRPCPPWPKGNQGFPIKHNPSNNTTAQI